MIVVFRGFIFGLDAALISGVVQSFSIEFGLSDVQMGNVVSAPGFGVLFAFIGMVVLIIILPWTKNKSIEEIDEALNGKPV